MHLASVDANLGTRRRVGSSYDAKSAKGYPFKLRSGDGPDFKRRPAEVRPQYTPKTGEDTRGQRIGNKARIDQVVAKNSRAPSAS